MNDDPARELNQPTLTRTLIITIELSHIFYSHHDELSSPLSSSSSSSFAIVVTCTRPDSSRRCRGDGIIIIIGTTARLARQAGGVRELSRRESKMHRRRDAPINNRRGVFDVFKVGIALDVAVLGRGIVLVLGLHEAQIQAAPVERCRIVGGRLHDYLAAV